MGLERAGQWGSGVRLPSNVGRGLGTDCKLTRPLDLTAGTRRMTPPQSAQAHYT
jgi:hypothetical protein